MEVGAGALDKVPDEEEAFVGRGRVGVVHGWVGFEGAVGWGVNWLGR